jgi:hypothetical protein
MYDVKPSLKRASSPALVEPFPLNTLLAAVYSFSLTNTSPPVQILPDFTGPRDPARIVEDVRFVQFESFVTVSSEPTNLWRKLGTSIFPTR